MDWLKQLFDKLLTLMPSTRLLTPYEAGIRITLGKYYKKIGPGWYVFWPLIQQIIYMEVQTQVVDLKVQSIPTSDKQDMMVSGAIQYNIKDIENALLNVQDVDKALTTLALGVIFDFVTKHTLDESRNTESLKKEILRGIREEAQGWGLKIEKVFVTDMGRTRNIRILGDGFQLIKESSSIS